MRDTTQTGDAFKLAELLHKTPALVRYGVRCGKLSCRCNEGRLHGPYAFLYWRDERGQQRRRYVRKADVDQVECIVHDRQRVDRETRHLAAVAQTELRQLRRWLDDLERRGER